MESLSDVSQALRSTLSTAGSVDVSVRVRINAPQSRVVDVLADGSLKVDLAAAPEQGKANMALQRLLAIFFGCDPSKVRILAGSTSRRKLVRVRL